MVFVVPPMAWFNSYLTNRQQFVKIKDTESKMQNIKCGVPQGSTLGPLLFLLYINDLANSSDKLLFRIFADDINIFYARDNPEEIENVMNQELKQDDIIRKFLCYNSARPHCYPVPLSLPVVTQGPQCLYTNINQKKC